MSLFALFFGLMSGCFLSVLVGIVGSKRRIGFGWAFLASLLLTVMMPKVVGVVLDQMTRIVRFWSFAFLNNSIIAVQEKIPLYKVLKMLFRESAMDS